MLLCFSIVVVFSALSLASQIFADVPRRVRNDERQFKATKQRYGPDGMSLEQVIAHVDVVIERHHGCLVCVCVCMCDRFRVFFCHLCRDQALSTLCLASLSCLLHRPPMLVWIRACDCRLTSAHLWLGVGFEHMRLKVWGLTLEEKDAPRCRSCCWVQFVSPTTFWTVISSHRPKM